MSTMPRAHPREFREDVVAVARKGDAPIAEIAKDFGISESCLRNWLRLADVADGHRPATAAPVESAELRELRRRNRLLEQENEVLRRAAAYLSQANLPGK
jgi:transposase